MGAHRHGGCLTPPRDRQSGHGETSGVLDGTRHVCGAHVDARGQPPAAGRSVAAPRCLRGRGRAPAGRDGDPQVRHRHRAPLHPGELLPAPLRREGARVLRGRGRGERKGHAVHAPPARELGRVVRPDPSPGALPGALRRRRGPLRRRDRGGPGRPAAVLPAAPPGAEHRQRPGGEARLVPGHRGVQYRPLHAASAHRRVPGGQIRGRAAAPAMGERGLERRPRPGHARSAARA